MGKRKEQQGRNLISAKSMEPFHPVDLMVFFALAVFCFFTMQQSDILHTGGSSFSILNGHFFDFYEYNQQFLSGNNYMITTYILFAIWNLPVYLLKLVTFPTMDVPYGVLMWYKALPTLFYFASACLMYLIGKRMNFSAGRCRLLAYAFATMPIAFFSQFMFGQYDIFTVFFMLCGIYFYFDDKEKSLFYFSLFFGVACTFKYFALLIFVPLLFLKEKRIERLLLHFACLALPVVLAVLPYQGGAAFQSGVAGFGATGYVLQAGISTGHVLISIVPVAWIAVCIYALLKAPFPEKGELFKWAVFLCNVVFCVAFGFSAWHPQWLLMAVPFWTMALATRERMDIACGLDLFLMLFFSMFTVNWWPNHVDSFLFRLGAFGPRVSGYLELAPAMRDIYRFTDVNILWTCFFGILLASTIMAHPQYCVKSIETKEKVRVGWVRLRFLVGVSIFLVPALLCLVAALGLG